MEALLRCNKCAQTRTTLAPKDKKNMEFDHIETPTLTKAQLSELLHDELGLNKRESKDIVDAFFYMLSDAVIQGQEVKITGFGNFQVRAKAARPGRNPRTSEAVDIAERHVVTFHASQKLKEMLQTAVPKQPPVDSNKG
jgi:integration host factor subunit alpha